MSTPEGFQEFDINILSPEYYDIMFPALSGALTSLMIDNIAPGHLNLLTSAAIPTSPLASTVLELNRIIGTIHGPFPVTQFPPIRNGLFVYDSCSRGYVTDHCDLLKAWASEDEGLGLASHNIRFVILDTDVDTLGRFVYFQKTGNIIYR